MTQNISERLLSSEDALKIKDFSMKLKLVFDFINRNSQFYTMESLNKICHSFGLKRVDSRFRQDLQLFAQMKFLELNSFNFESLDNFITEELNHTTGDLVVTKSFGAASLLTGSMSQVKNYIKPISLEKLYVTNYPLIDNFFKYSLILNKISHITKLTDVQKMQMKQLIIFLNNRADYVRQFIGNLTSSCFIKNQQNILVDYFENLYFNNLRISKNFGNKRTTPFLIELNGMPGVGKTIFLDTLEQFVKELFPFIDEDDLTYTRTNDKFWNGYNQQPIVLFDDPNQNKQLLYDLDNEIIQLGSGRFVYPPMAFAKETKFSSLFILFTTNKRILATTKVNKGAIARRINTHLVSVKADLGEIVTNEHGKYWRYFDHIKFSPFHLIFDKKNTFLDIFEEMCVYISNQNNVASNIVHYSKLNDVNTPRPQNIEEAVDEFLPFFRNELERYRRDYQIRGYSNIYALDGHRSLESRVKSTTQELILPIDCTLECKNFEIHIKLNESKKCVDVLCRIDTPLRQAQYAACFLKFSLRSDKTVRIEKNSSFFGYNFYFPDEDFLKCLIDVHVKYVNCVGYFDRNASVLHK